MNPFEKEKVIIEKQNLQVTKQIRGRLDLLLDEMDKIKEEIKKLSCEKHILRVNKDELI